MVYEGIGEVINNIPDGVELIEDKNPNWFNEVDITRLDMGCLTNCILGQLYGSYSKGREALGLDCGMGDHYGLDQCFGALQWGPLTDAWIDMIKSKRSA